MKFILDENASSKKFILTEATLDDAGWEKLDWSAEFKKPRPEQGIDGSDPDKMSMDQLWNKYYEVAWKDKQDKVKALGFPFQQELLKGGFRKDANPFINFISYALANETAFAGMFSEKYAGIHNAYIKGYITDENLKTPSDDCLLYWPGLYTQASGSEILIRLKQGSKRELTGVFNQYAKGKTLTYPDFFKVLFMAKTPELAKEFTKDNLISDLEKASSITLDKKTLRSQTNVTDLLAFLGKTESESKKEVTEDSTKELWSTIKSKIDKKNAPQLLCYIAFLGGDKTAAHLKGKGVVDIETIMIPFKTGVGFMNVLKGLQLNSPAACNKMIDNLLSIPEFKDKLKK